MLFSNIQENMRFMLLKHVNVMACRVSYNNNVELHHYICMYKFILRDTKWHLFYMASCFVLPHPLQRLSSTISLPILWWINHNPTIDI